MKGLVASLLIAVVLVQPAAAADTNIDFRGSAIVSLEVWSGVAAVHSQNPNGNAALWIVTIKQPGVFAFETIDVHAWTRGSVTRRGTILLEIRGYGTVEISPADANLRADFMSSYGKDLPFNWRHITFRTDPVVGLTITNSTPLIPPTTN